MGIALERVLSCDLCGGRDFDPRHMWSDQLLFGPERWTLVRCRRCTLHFLDPRPTREAICDFYPSDYAAHLAPPTRAEGWQRSASARGAEVPFWKRPLINVRQDLSWYYFPRWHGEGRVVDLGCGSGGRYLDVLKDLGWKTYGIEPSPTAVANAVAKGHEAVVGSAEDAAFPEESMDVATMWHALEHTHSPSRALASCFRMLRPGGLLNLCVPNWNSLQAALYGPFWWSCDAPRHLYQFTRATVRRYVEQAGFRVVRITTRTGPTSWQRAGRHFLNAALRTRWTRDSSLLVSLLAPLTVLGSFVRYFGVGSELRVIAERPA